MGSPLLLLLILAAAAGSSTTSTALAGARASAGFGSSTTGTECSFGHVINEQGAIEFPVFHKNHPCLRLKGTGSDQIEGSAIDVIEDNSVNTFLFLMPIKLGTPPVMNLVAIDTGSTLSWVQCKPCKPHYCHDQAPAAGLIFDPSNSTTFRHARCKSRECFTIKYTLRLEFANCMEKEDTCLYAMTYGGGWAYTAGKVVWDNLTIGNEEDTVSFSLLFGCSLDVEYSGSEAGVIGFGTSSFSFFEQVAKKINYKSFSYCLPSDEDVKGYLSLGDYRRQGIDGYTPLFVSTSRPTYSLTMVRLVANGQSLLATSSEMIVDSGSMWTILLPDTLGRLDEAITKAMAPINYSRSYSRGPSYICFTSRADSLNFKGKHSVFSDWSTLPTMEMAFAGGAVTLPLPPKNLFHNNPNHGLCMNFIKTDNVKVQILGNRVTRSMETIFDIQGNRFGFRYAAC